jgi:hypothetical protein
MTGPVIDEPGRLSRLVSEPFPQVNFLASLSGAARSADNLLSLAHQQLKVKAENLRDEWEQEASKFQARLTETLFVGANSTPSSSVNGLSAFGDQGQPGQNTVRNGVRRAFSTSALRRGQRSNSETEDGEVYAALRNLQQGMGSKDHTPRHEFFAGSPSFREQVRSTNMIICTRSVDVRRGVYCYSSDYTGQDAIFAS